MIRLDSPAILAGCIVGQTSRKRNPAKTAGLDRPITR